MSQLHIHLNRPVRTKRIGRRRKTLMPFRPINARPRRYRPGLSALSGMLARFKRSESNGEAFSVAQKTSGDNTQEITMKTTKSGAKTMTREELTNKIVDTKRAQGWSWKYICEQIGGISPVLIIGALLGQHRLVKPLAKKAAQLFGLSEAEERMLNEVPMRGAGLSPVPTDPLIYRFYEVMLINGPAWKAIIEEEFGDGIMSAIDFDFEIERQPDPKGDRVKVTMSGKFLPYKYFGATEGVPALGLKELDQ